MSTPVLPAHRRNERAAVTTARWRPLGRPLAVMRRAFCRRMLFPIFLVGAFVAPPSIAANIGELDRQLQMIEVDLLGFPGRAEAELDALAAQTRAPDGATRRFGAALLGQARVAAAHIDLALNLADQLEQEGRQSRNDATAAVALLIRSDAHVWRGDVPHANLIANNARTLAQNADDSYVRYWAAMAFGITGRMLGQVDEARASLREAYVIADNAQNPYRRAAALYQLSVLDRMTRQADRALAQSQQAFAEAKLAGSTFGMAKAKMAESAALEVLDRPVGELAAMHEALAIARAAGSGVEESLALINLADIHLRRKDFDAVLEVSRQSLELATRSGDGALIATNKANMGFALFGLGRTDAGKRLAEEALAETERTGASAEIVDLMEEYGRYLAQAGDYKAALALRDRQHKVIERIATTTRKQGLARISEQVRLRAAHQQARTREPGVAATHLVDVRRHVRALIPDRGLPVPEGADDQPPARAAQHRAGLLQHAGPADVAVQPPPFPELHRRSAGDRRIDAASRSTIRRRRSC